MSKNAPMLDMMVTEDFLKSSKRLEYTSTRAVIVASHPETVCLCCCRIIVKVVGFSFCNQASCRY